jgi:hypothetical protein
MPIFLRQLGRTLFLVALLSTLMSPIGASLPGRADQPLTYIVQANSTETAAAAVIAAGGVVTEQLSIINGVSATLALDALYRLHNNPQIVVHNDAVVTAAGAHLESLDMPAQGVSAQITQPLLYPSIATESAALQQTSIQTEKASCKNKKVTKSPKTELRTLMGWSVTVAFIDSGLLKMRNPASWSRDAATGTLSAEYGDRCIVYRDFLPRTPENGNAGINANNSVDQNGHGTHVIASVGDYRPIQVQPNSPPIFTGVAPGTNVLAARALDRNGQGSYTSVIAAIQWVVANKVTYNVRVLNLSLYAPVNGPYWSDPLNQAVMKAWQAGITVIVAAGNSGPDAGSITVPGNVPYVISVGAIKSGRYTPNGVDELAFYSSRGPTESGFIKPDVLVPASRTIAPIPDSSVIASEMPAARIQEHADIIDPLRGALFEPTTYYQLSGTSMAAAQVSGIAALIIQKSPALTNDQIKARLMGTANTVIETSTGQPVYSPWEQGAGKVNTQQAVFAATNDRANIGMDINLDLTSTTHYWGYTIWNDPTGELWLIDPVTGQKLAIWDSKFRVWGGGLPVWGGKFRVWGGGLPVWGGKFRVWGGGTSTWAGNESLWAGANRFWAGTTPSAAAKASHASIVVFDNEPTFTLANPISPVLECVVNRGNGSYIAFFGYQNDNAVPAAILLSDGNMFSSAQRYRGQPTTFAPGRVRNAFSVDFDGSNLAWILNGRTATASSGSTACTP